MKQVEERYKPKIASENLIESLFHLHRYLIASRFVKNKIVLDAASGEGYGSFILSKNARKVFGVDIDEKTILEAKKKYKNEKIYFLNANVTNLPFTENFFDVIISFETIEHLSKEDGIKFLEQIKKILKKDGILILSTPNKERTLFSSYKNIYHIYEYYESEIVEILKKYFKNVKIYNQEINLFSLIYDKDTKKTSLLNLKLENENQPFFITKEQINLPLYKIYICSNKTIRINFESTCHDIKRYFLNNFYNELNFYEKLLKSSEEEINRLNYELNFYEKLLKSSEEEINRLNYELKYIKDEKINLEKVLNNILNAKWFKISYFFYLKIKKLITFKL